MVVIMAVPPSDETLEFVVIRQISQSNVDQCRLSLSCLCSLSYCRLNHYHCFARFGLGFNYLFRSLFRFFVTIFVQKICSAYSGGNDYSCSNCDHYAFACGRCEESRLGCGRACRFCSCFRCRLCRCCPSTCRCDRRRYRCAGNGTHDRTCRRYCKRTCECSKVFGQ